VASVSTLSGRSSSVAGISFRQSTNTTMTAPSIAGRDSGRWIVRIIVA
jgi:hypothetical protein